MPGFPTLAQNTPPVLYTVGWVRAVVHRPLENIGGKRLEHHERPFVFVRIPLFVCRCVLARIYIYVFKVGAKAIKVLEKQPNYVSIYATRRRRRRRRLCFTRFELRDCRLKCPRSRTAIIKQCGAGDPGGV